MNISSLSVSSSSCSPEIFPVPLFGDSPNSYAALSDQAHIVLGVFLALIVLVWCLHLMEFLTVQRAYRFSALAQLAMGIYLFLWVFVLLQPGNLQAAYQYWSKDLLQLQHCAIAALLVSAGFIDFLQSGKFLQSRHWALLWTVNMTIVGLLFMLHPQKGYSAAVKHIALGTSICFAALLYGRAKEKLLADLWLPEPQPASADIDWALISGGGSFAMASCILILFRDSSAGVHHGTARECQPAWPLTQFAYFFAALTVFSALFTMFLFSRFSSSLILCLFPADGCCCKALDRWFDGEKKPRKKKSLAEPQFYSAASASEESDEEKLRILEELKIDIELETRKETTL